MFKSILAAVAVSVVAIVSAANPALSESKPCYYMPKSGVPCIIAPQPPQLPRLQRL